jgi:hypothetical protein
MAPSARDGLDRSQLGRALRWKPQTQLGVWVVALACGAIWLAVQLANPVWSASTRLVLAAPMAVVLVAIGGLTGSMRLRRRLRDRQWSASHPIDLSRAADGREPECDFSARRARHRPRGQQE